MPHPPSPSPSPSPKTHTFTLPSLYDSTPLACTLHHPHLTPPDAPRGIALFAHPYAPLGGNSSDPVLTLATTAFLEKGYLVCLFDFRGAGRSGGRTSWTGRGERGDFVSLVGFCAVYVATWGFVEAGQEMEMVLGGYSYGSLVVQSLPPFGSLLGRFRTAAAGDDSRSGEWRIIAQAKALAAEHDNEQVSQHHNSAARPTLPRFRSSYLLISPLLPPISTLLTLQFGTVFGASNDDSALRKNKTLGIFGGHDSFTSSARLIKWAKRLEGVKESRFNYAEIGEAGHFWREDGVGRRLQDGIALWLDAPYT